MLKHDMAPNGSLSVSQWHLLARMITRLMVCGLPVFELPHFETSLSRARAVVTVLMTNDMCTAKRELSAVRSLTKHSRSSMFRSSVG